MLQEARKESTASKNRVSLSISSMGAYRVRSAIPVVVPPSVATLFIGAPRKMPDPGQPDGAYGTVSFWRLIIAGSMELVRWFLSDVRRGIEQFDLA